MISLADLIFLVGVAVALSGCWLRGVPDFVVGAGLALCVAGVVVGRIRASRRRAKQR